jgi:hypothetical protein
MPPFQINPVHAQQQLDSVPVSYIIVGKGVLGIDRYTLPVIYQFTQKWKKVFTAPGSEWTVYRYISR